MSQATVIGPTNNVQIWTTAYHGPQALLVGDLGACTASCTIGNCGDTRPVLTKCDSGTPFVVPPGSINFDTLTLGQITASQAMYQRIMQPWGIVVVALGGGLLGTIWRRHSAKRRKWAAPTD
jgi:hypothetical protein